MEWFSNALNPLQVLTRMGAEMVRVSLSYRTLLTHHHFLPSARDREPCKYSSKLLSSLFSKNCNVDCLLDSLGSLVDICSVEILILSRLQSRIVANPQPV
jgi:hypothetical protein